MSKILKAGIGGILFVLVLPFVVLGFFSEIAISGFVNGRKAYDKFYWTVIGW